jgi:Tol biopolymer transport system component
MQRTSKVFALVCSLPLAALACRQDLAGPAPSFSRSSQVATTTAANPAIAYGHQKGNDYALWVMNTDGTNQTRLVVSSYAPHPSWSADGHSIAYHATTNGINRIDVSVSNGTPQASPSVVLPITRSAFDIAWSPNALNSQIAYSENPINTGDQVGLWLAPAAPVTPYVESRVYVASPGNKVRWITWNAQATKIAFVQRSQDGKIDSLFVLDLTTSPAPTATFRRAFPGGVAGVSWSRTLPDRLALAVPVATSTGCCSGPFQPSFLDLTTNTLSNAPTGTSAVWSPDDSRIVFINSTTSGTGPISAVTLSTGATVTLANSGVEPDWRRTP